MGTDPELDAMGAVVAALDGLNEDARARVLDWSARRFGVTTASNVTGEPSGLPRRQGGSATRQDAEYASFADLLAAGNVKTDSQRALLAAYWHQVVGGKLSFQSQELNKDLRDTGHYIKSVTDAMDALIGTKPQQMVQLKKAGSSRQARRTFKLTSAGIDAAADMLVVGAAPSDAK